MQTKTGRALELHISVLQHLNKRESMCPAHTFSQSGSYVMILDKGVDIDIPPF